MGNSYTPLSPTKYNDSPEEKQENRKACKNQDDTPLIEACRNGNLGRMMELITNEANINQPNNSGMTPLHIACGKQQGKGLEIVKLLLQHGANINQTNEKGTTPLYIALLLGQEEIAKELINNGVDINELRPDNATPLYMACRKGFLAIVQALIKQGVDINEARDYCGNSTTPLIGACSGGHAEVVKFLLENGADIHKTNKNGETPFLIAYQNKGVLEVLIKKGAIKYKDSSSYLLQACQEGNLDAVILLIENGYGDINKQDKNGCTPLYIACENNYLKIVQQLVENSAWKNKANNQGKTPLKIANEKNYTDIAEYLEQWGARELSE